MCKKDNSICFALGILAGIVGGIAAGVLYAPKPGKEFRDDIKKTVIDVAEKYSPEIQKAKKQALDIIKNSKYKIEEQYNNFLDNMKAEKLANAKNIETDVYNM